MNAVTEPRPDSLIVDLLPDLGMAIRALQSMRDSLDDLLRDFDEVIIEIVRCRDDEQREQLLSAVRTLARVRGIRSGFEDNRETRRLLGELRTAARSRRDWRTRAARVNGAIDRALGA